MKCDEDKWDEWKERNAWWCAPIVSLVALSLFPIILACALVDMAAGLLADALVGKLK